MHACRQGDGAERRVARRRHAQRLSLATVEADLSTEQVRADEQPECFGYIARMQVAKSCG